MVIFYIIPSTLVSENCTVDIALPSPTFVCLLILVWTPIFISSVIVPCSHYLFWSQIAQIWPVQAALR